MSVGVNVLFKTVADLAKIGITVQLQTTDWAVYLNMQTNGKLSLYMLGWTGDNGDPDNFVCYFFCQPVPRTRDSTLSPVLKEYKPGRLTAPPI
jgi:ABC-type transport system substrate-binding protein